MSRKWWAPAAVAVTVVGSYWYFSPYLVMKAMRNAAQHQDAEAFNERVDYPRVRESLKGQMSAMVADQLGESHGGAESFGAMLGLALANQMVDAFVRPEVVMHAMEDGDLKPRVLKRAGPDESPAQPKRELVWYFERKGVNKVIAYGRKPDQPADEGSPGFVFERTGFADWKLTEIRLPQTPPQQP